MNTTTHMINPQNPYVFDEDLFANQPHLNFNGSSYALFLRIIDTVVPSLGILTASIVAYLAIFQTPTHIKTFSKMILLCSITDIFYASVDLFCQTVNVIFWHKKFCVLSKLFLNFPAFATQQCRCYLQFHRTSFFV